MQAFFRASTFTVIGDGNTALFWEDRWLLGSVVSDIAPNLAMLVSKRIKGHQAVRQGFANRQWARSITGGLTDTAVAEYLDLWEATENVILSDQPDRTVCGAGRSQVGLRQATHRVHPLSWPHPHLEDMGAAKGEDLPVAGLQEAPLD